MKDIDLNKKFVSALEKKIPKKTNLAGFIADTLCIEKESAYRRLRNEIPFSFGEVALLANQINISLDKIIPATASGINPNNLLGLPLISNPEVNKSDLIEAIYDFFMLLTDQPYSEFGTALSGVNFVLFQSYSLLSRFHIMKHLHYSGNSSTPVPFERIFESNKQLELRSDFQVLFHKISYTYYIWDLQIIPALVNDILYFRNIRLLKESETNALKMELLRFLQDLEQLASTGTYKETGARFELYVSDINIDVSYSYMWSDEIFASAFSAFIFFAVPSLDESFFKNMTAWIKSIKRCSTQISVINDKERSLFFDRQRQLVNTL
jgi:hypothetical protein